MHIRQAQPAVPPVLPHRRWPVLSSWTLATGLMALMVATPMLVVVSSLATPSVEIWRHLWATQLPELLGNTLILLGGVGVGVTVLGTGLAWLVTMYCFPGRALFEWLLILPLAMPAYVIGFVFLALFDYAGPVQSWLRRLVGGPVWFPEMASAGGVVLVMTLVFYPYVYMLARAAFLEQSATTLEAARALSAKKCLVFWRVALPLARPSIVVGVTLALMETLADFGTVSMFNYSTFTVAIYRVWFGLFNRQAATELASLLLLWTALLYLMERRQRGRARFYQTAGSVRPVVPTLLTGWRGWAATSVVALLIGLAFLVPVAQLIVWAAVARGDAWHARYTEFFWHTLTLALITAMVAVCIAVILAYGQRLSRGRLVTCFSRIASLGYALPGSVIAVGVLVPLSWFDHTLDTVLQTTFGRSSGLFVTGSMGGLVFAYLVRFLAVSAQTVEASLVKITPSMDMAARSLGAPPGRVLRQIHLPLMRAGLSSAAILVFVDVMKEMPATLLLRPFGYDTLAVRVWQLTSESLWELAALPALTIVGVGMLPVLVLIRSSVRPGRD